MLIHSLCKRGGCTLLLILLHSFLFVLDDLRTYVDSLRRRAWPKLVGLHERLWDDDGAVNNEFDKARDTMAQKTRAAAAVTANTTLPPHHSSHTDDDDNNSASSTNSLRDKILAKSLDFTQIERDVTRCTWHLLTGTQRAQRLQMEHKRHKKVARLIRRKQRRLANLINLALVQSYRDCCSISRASSSAAGAGVVDNTLRYYQGYHDVACIILSTLSGSSPVRLQRGANVNSLEEMAVATGLEMPTAVLLQLSKSHFRDCMRANFLQLQTALRLTLMPLIAYFDPDVHDLLSFCEMEPFFALSWVITWFSHEIRDTELVKRLFDFFLVSHPLMPIYVSVAMVCHPLNRQDVLQTECDFSLVHHTLTALPKNSSMVGWKYRPGDGYVSDDEQDDEDDESSCFSPTMCDSQSSVDTEFLLREELNLRQRGGVTEEAGAEAVSIVSSSLSSMAEARVPFQELIDTAINYMERMPPRNLIGLATRYYGKEQVQDLVIQAPGISMLKTPPAWCWSNSAKADWVLKQKARDARGGVSLHRGSFSRDSSQTSKLLLDVNDEQDLKRLLVEEKDKSSAVIAAGFGHGDDAARRRRKQRKMAIAGAVAVAVVAIVVGVVLQHRARPSAPTSSSSSDTCLVATRSQQETTKAVHIAGEGAVVLATSSASRGASRAKERAFSPRTPLALKLPLFSIPIWLRKCADRERGGGDKDGVGDDRPPSLFAIMGTTVLRETALLGERLGEMGSVIVKRPLKSLPAKKRGILDQEVARGQSEPDYSFILSLVKEGVDVVISPIAQAIHQLILDLEKIKHIQLEKLSNLRRIQLAKLANFKRDQLAKLSELSHALIENDFGDSVKKAIESPALHDAIRGASIMNQYESKKRRRRKPAMTRLQEK